MAERVVIIVDGSNFYHRLREAGFRSVLSLDYTALTRSLAGKRMVAWKRYYIGAVREEPRKPKSRELRRGQRQLMQNLRRHGWNMSFGHMLKTDGVYHEKGVDVLMAVDLVAGAYENEYDTAILVSSDTDLIPALQKVRSKGKKIEYIGFSHKPSYGLISHSDIRRLLTKEDLEKFI